MSVHPLHRYAFAGPVIADADPLTDNVIAAGKGVIIRYTGTSLAARKAYHVLPTGSDAPLRLSFDGDTATSIDIVQAAAGIAQDAVYYNLAGQRVVNPPRSSTSSTERKHTSNKGIHTTETVEV